MELRSSVSTMDLSCVHRGRGRGEGWDRGEGEGEREQVTVGMPGVIMCTCESHSRWPLG